MCVRVCVCGGGGVKMLLPTAFVNRKQQKVFGEILRAFFHETNHKVPRHLLIAHHLRHVNIFASLADLLPSSFLLIAEVQVSIFLTPHISITSRPHPDNGCLVSIN